MYISGNQFNFSNRLHQFANSGQDIILYAAEANSNYAGAGIHWSNITKWNTEIRKVLYECSGVTTGNYITGLGVN